jgi:hypothetical protein
MPSKLEARLDRVGAGRERGERREKSVTRDRPRSVLGFGDGDGVAIETQQTTVSDELLQNRPCMSAPPKSGIQVGATRPYVQRGQYLR